MTDLPISGVLDVTVDQASKRAAQQELEEDLGHLSVGVEAQTGGGRGGNVRGREAAMQRQHLAESNDIATEQLTVLTEINDRVDENLDLNTRRNELLGDIKDASEDTERNLRGRGGGLGGLGGGAVGLTIGLAGASGLVSALQNFDWPELPEFSPLPIEEPPEEIGYGGPDPVPVDTPEDVPYSGPDPIPVDAPTEIPVTQPEGSPTDTPAPTDSPSPGPLQTPKFDLPVNARDVGLGVVGGGLAGAAGKILSNLPKGAPSGAAGGIGFPSPGALIAETAGQGRRKSPNNRNFIESALSNIIGSRFGGGPTAAATGAATAAFQGGQDSQQRTGQRQQRVELNFSPTYEVPIRELERRVQSDIQELERQIDQLERSLTGRGR